MFYEFANFYFDDHKLYVIIMENFINSISIFSINYLYRPKIHILQEQKLVDAGRDNKLSVAKRCLDNNTDINSTNNVS